MAACRTHQHGFPGCLPWRRPCRLHGFQVPAVDRPVEAAEQRAPFLVCSLQHGRTPHVSDVPRQQTVQLTKRSAMRMPMKACTQGTQAACCTAF